MVDYQSLPWPSWWLVQRSVSALASLLGYEVATGVAEARVLLKGTTQTKMQVYRWGGVSVPACRHSSGPLAELPETAWEGPRVSTADSASWVCSLSKSSAMFKPRQNLWEVSVPMLLLCRF